MPPHNCLNHPLRRGFRLAKNGSDRAQTQHYDPIGELENLTNVVTYDHDPASLVPKSQHQFHDVSSFPETERGGRLVQKQDIAIV
jgi:uncharacterized protein (DUF2249 family)